MNRAARAIALIVSAGILIAVPVLLPAALADPASAWANLAEARSFTSSAATTTHLFVIGGAVSGGWSDKITKFAFSDATRTEPKTLPAGTGWLATCSLGNIAYILGGERSTGVTNKAYKYDMANNVLDAIEDMPGARSKMGAYCHNGNVWVFGGSDGTNCKDTIYQYAVTLNQWVTRVETMPTATCGHAVTGNTTGQAYIAGGKNNLGTCLDQFLLFDTTLGTWATKAPLPSGRYGVSATNNIVGDMANPKVFVFAGDRCADGFSNGYVTYDINTTAWSSHANHYGSARYGTSAANDGATGGDGANFYVTGGSTSSGSYITEVVKN